MRPETYGRLVYFVASDTYGAPNTIHFCENKAFQKQVPALQFSVQQFSAVLSEMLFEIVVLHCRLSFATSRTAFH